MDKIIGKIIGKNAGKNAASENGRAGFAARWRDVVHGRGGRPSWWGLLVAALVFAVFVTGAFIWQASTAVTAEKIQNELIGLDPDITIDELERRGYVDNGTVQDGWANIDGEDFPRYMLTKKSEPIERFVSDVRFGRQSVLRTYTVKNGSLDRVRILWYDPSVKDEWVTMTGSGESSVTTVHYGGQGQIRQWWWQHGGLSNPDKRFARDIAVRDGTLVLNHRPTTWSTGVTYTSVPTEAYEVLYAVDNSSAD